MIEIKGSHPLMLSPLLADNHPFNRPNTQSKPNPFSALAKKAGLSPQSVDVFLTEMHDALGEKSPYNQLSEDSLNKYMKVLNSANEILDETIRFSQRSASPAQQMYEEQKKALKQRIDFTQTVSKLMKEGKSLFSNGSILA